MAPRKMTTRREQVPEENALVAHSEAQLTPDEQDRFILFRSRELGSDRGFAKEDLAEAKFPEFIQSVVTSHGWEKFALHPPQNAVVSLVVEWYSKLQSSDAARAKEIIMRGVCIPLEESDIRNYYALPEVQECSFWEIKNSVDPELLAKVKAKLCIAGTEWNRSSTRKFTLLRQRFNHAAKFWYQFLRARIQPTSHIKTVSRERAILLWCILEGKPVDIPRIVLNEMWCCAAVNSGKLWFPGFITDLCLNAGVLVEDGEKTEPIKGLISASNYTRLCEEEEEDKEKTKEVTVEASKRKKEAVSEPPKKKAKTAAATPSKHETGQSKVQKQSGKSSQSKKNEETEASSGSKVDSKEQKTAAGAVEKKVLKMEKDLVAIKGQMGVIDKKTDEALDLLKTVLETISNNACVDLYGDLLPTPGLRAFSNRLYEQEKELKQVKKAVDHLEKDFGEYMEYVNSRDKVLDQNFTKQFLRFQHIPSFPRFAPAAETEPEPPKSAPKPAAATTTLTPDTMPIPIPKSPTTSFKTPATQFAPSSSKKPPKSPKPQPSQATRRSNRISRRSSQPQSSTPITINDEAAEEEGTNDQEQSSKPEPEVKSKGSVEEEPIPIAVIPALHTLEKTESTESEESDSATLSVHA